MLLFSFFLFPSLHECSTPPPMPNFPSHLPLPCQTPLTQSLPPSPDLRRTTRTRIITTTSDATTGNLDITKGDIRTTPAAAEDIVIPGRAGRRSRHVDEVDAVDRDAVCGGSRRTAVEVVLLDVDAVVGDA